MNFEFHCYTLRSSQHVEASQMSHRLVNGLMWSSHTVEYHSAMKRNKMLLLATTWSSPNSTVFGTRSRSQEHVCHVTPFTGSVQSRQIHRGRGVHRLWGGRAGTAFLSGVTAVCQK